MKFNLSKKSISTYVMFAALGISVFLHTYQIQKMCLNEDEAAQGYNTYSVLQTGYDEYGKIPFRYLSFGENKLPLTGTLSAPFIAFFGLNDLTVRLPILLIGIIFPLLFYGAAYSLTQSKNIAVIACVLASTNTWLYTMSRHQHEAVVLAAIVLILITLVFRDLQDPDKNKDTGKKNTFMKTMLKIALLLFMGLYTYHSAKVIVPFFAVTVLVIVWKRYREKFLTAFILVCAAFLVFGATEIIQPTNRVESLSYFTSPVFTHEIEEGRRLGGSPLYYNKVVYGAHRVIQRTFEYVSPSFLLFESDPNPRYGSVNVHLLTFFEYAMFLLGLVLLWVKRHPARYFLSLMILVTIVPAVAAMPVQSLTRSFLMTIPIIIIVSIAIAQLMQYVRSPPSLVHKVSLGILVGGIIVHITGLGSSGKNYFMNYLNSTETHVAWQCGTREMSEYVWENYDKFDSFYITRRYGQPYIFLLFYKPYPPHEYQKIARTGQYNEYGFWEQDGFDKFIFQKPLVYKEIPRSAFIMTPEEVNMSGLDPKRLKPLLHDGRVRFYVKENL